MVYDNSVKVVYTENNLVAKHSFVYLGYKKGSGLLNPVETSKMHKIPYTKYQIKETDMRVKTASFTSPLQLDLTTGQHIIKIVSKYHENFIGEVLSDEYTANSDGTYTYQCQDFSREYQSKCNIVVSTLDVYRVLISLITREGIPIAKKDISSLKKNYKKILSGLRPKKLYDQGLWGNIVSINQMEQKYKMVLKDISYMEAIRDLCFSGGYIDVYFNHKGILQIEPFSAEDWKTTGLYLTTNEIASRKFKFDTTNAITGAVIQSTTPLKAGNEYKSSDLINLDLSAFFGKVEATASNPTSGTPTTITTTKTTKASTSKNPYGKKKRKVWINADNGSDAVKKKVAERLKKEGWSVHIGQTGSNAHYRDYFNVTKDYQCYITLYNGFCAGTIREAYSSKIQNVLKNKGVVLVPMWDSSGWTNPKGMKPYRYGDFSGYSAKRAWDDNFSKSNPSIKNVGDWLKKNNAKYCVSPTVDGLVKMFLAGGYFASKSNKTVKKTNTTTVNKATLNNIIANEKAKTLELINESARKYLTLKLTVPLGNPNFKKVHTNQWLFTELPQEFSLENWTAIAEALSSNYTRYGGYVLNRWYIEGTTIDVNVKGDSTISLDLNAFASSISDYSDGRRKLSENYTSAQKSADKTSSSKTKTNAVKTKNTTLKGGQGKTIDNLVEKIVGSTTDQLKKAKLIHNWLKDNVRYKRYCCAKYKNPEDAYKNRKHLNCADTALLTCRMMLSGGLTAYIVHRTSNNGHFWTVIEIGGKYYVSDQTGNGSGWNTLWYGTNNRKKPSGKGGNWNKKCGKSPDCSYYPC